MTAEGAIQPARIDEKRPEALGPMSADQAIQLVGLHRRRAIGIGKWPGVRRGQWGTVYLTVPHCSA
jgi:hypothetical protein